MEQSFTPVNPLELVHRFMEIGCQSTKNFNVKQAGLFTGLQLEEIAEKLALIAAAEPDSTSSVQLGELVNLKIDNMAEERRERLKKAEADQKAAAEKLEEIRRSMKADGNG